MNDFTQIRVSKKTRKRLRLMASKGVSYDNILNKLINIKQKVDNTEKLKEWFRGSYHLFGFTDLIRESPKKSVDYVMMKGDTRIDVKIETLSSNFIAYGCSPDDVDYVICLLKDEDVSVDVIEIDSFSYVPSKSFKAIAVSESIRNVLREYKDRDITWDGYFRAIINLLKRDSDFYEKIEKEQKRIKEEHELEARRRGERRGI